MVANYSRIGSRLVHPRSGLIKPTCPTHNQGHDRFSKWEEPPSNVRHVYVIHIAGIFGVAKMFEYTSYETHKIMA